MTSGGRALLVILLAYLVVEINNLAIASVLHYPTDSCMAETKDVLHYYHHHQNISNCHFKTGLVPLLKSIYPKIEISDHGKRIQTMRLVSIPLQG